MSLGFLQRVALWRYKRRRPKLLHRITVLHAVDPSNPEYPLALANFWREVGPEVFTSVPMDIQISVSLNHRLYNLDHLSDVLGKLLVLIGNDEYTQYMAYLTKQYDTIRTSTLSEYLTRKNGQVIDIVETYTRINGLLYSLASLLDTQETYEYHRGLNVVYRDMLKMLEQAINYTPH